MIDDDKDYIMNEQGFTPDIWQGSGKLEELAQDESELHSGLESIKGLDTKVGEKHCGGAELYRVTLGAFADSAEEYAADIRRYVSADDRENAAIKIHSLKGAARTVGAEELGETAYQGEMFYRGRTQECPDIEAMLAELGRLAREIRDKL